MYCKECGAKTEDGKFCKECGANLKPLSHKQEERPITENMADIGLALLIPILGIFIGINNLFSKEKDNGPLIIILSLIGFIIYYWILSSISVLFNTIG